MTDLVEKALQAGDAWGGFKARPRLVAQRENAVFDVTLRNGKRAALRLHRPGYQTSAAIWSEQSWTDALAAKGFPCPTPIETEFGAYLLSFGSGHRASLVSWIDAVPLAERVQDANTLALCMQKLGQLIRQMHEATDQIDTSVFERPSWDAEALLGVTPHWGPFWENPSLTEQEIAILQTTRVMAAKQLETMQLDTGLIHADLLQENILQNDDGLHIIDFDDAGFGYRLFDLGTALVQFENHPDLAHLSAALCAGYGCDPAQMPLFITLRAMASCGWVITRLPHDDPRQRLYAERALRCAKRLTGA